MHLYIFNSWPQGVVHVLLLLNAELLSPIDSLNLNMVILQVEQRKRKDLLYAEVEIAESPHLKPQPAQVARKANTHYTFINEESTRALLQMSNARRENR